MSRTEAVRWTIPATVSDRARSSLATAVRSVWNVPESPTHSCQTNAAAGFFGVWESAVAAKARARVATSVSANPSSGLGRGGVVVSTRNPPSPTSERARPMLRKLAAAGGSDPARVPRVTARVGWPETAAPLERALKAIAVAARC